MNPPPWVHYLYIFGLADGENKMVFGLANRENKMYTWLVIPKKNRYKSDHFSSFFCFFGIEKSECSMHLEYSVENGEKHSR